MVQEELRELSEYRGKRKLDQLVPSSAVNVIVKDVARSDAVHVGAEYPAGKKIRLDIDDEVNTVDLTDD